LWREGPDKPANLVVSEGSSDGGTLTETIHIDAGVDKSLVRTFHVAGIEKSIKHGHVTPARTPPTDGATVGMENGGGGGGHRRHRRWAAQTKGRMTSSDDGNVIMQSHPASASERYTHKYIGV